MELRGVELATQGVARIDAVRRRREELVAACGEPLKPYVYVIVATGNIYEDAAQAQAAARAGADVIAVIRTTAQSLLDYVPYGETTEGFGGTYATQENFRLMRAALDEVGAELGRYIRLCNYASGLCMPEIATMGALERLDMMLNDSMYGIIFRNINMQRTFVDQYLSRLINARAGIIINTGEDNYLTTADAFEKGYTVVSSDFINEAFALRANLEPWQIGLGHAFEINPATPDQVVYQVADAQLIRQLFPEYPLKYMPPTKYMPGDIFQGHIIDGMFNFTGIFTGQEIMLLGMLTEALHTPLLQDRYVSIKNAKYVFEACRHLADEVEFRSGGIIEKRADDVLRRATEQLEHVREISLFKALEDGEFADVKRDPRGGRGFEGVFKTRDDYFNPLLRGAARGSSERTADRPRAGRVGARRDRRWRHDRQALRRHPRRRHDAVLVHAADRLLGEGRRRRQAVRREARLPRRRRGRVQGDRPRVHLLRRLRAHRDRHRPRRGQGRLPRGRGDGLLRHQRVHQGAPRPQAVGGRRGHRKRRPHGGHRRHPQHEGFRRQLRLRALSRDGGREHGLADPLRAAPAHGPRPRTPTPSSSRRSSPRRTSTCRT